MKGITTATKPNINDCLLLLISCIVIGCAGPDSSGIMGKGVPIPLPGTYKYDLTSAPSGADVYVNGKYKGKTPLEWKRTLLLQTVENIEFRVVLQDHEDGIVAGNNYGSDPSTTQNATVLRWGPTTRIKFNLPLLAEAENRYEKQSKRTPKERDESIITAKEEVAEMSSPPITQKSDGFIRVSLIPTHPQSADANTSLDWKDNPEAFAKLFFGEDLEVPRIKSRTKVIRMPEIKNIVADSYIEWPAKYGIELGWRTLPEEKQSTLLSLSSNLAIYAPFGDPFKGYISLMNVTDAEGNTYEKSTRGISIGSDVAIRMKVTDVIPVVLGKDVLCLWLSGTDFTISTTTRRCDWPEYNEKYPSYFPGGFGSSEFRPVKISNTFPFPVKVALRSENNGIDFGVSAHDYAMTYLPCGEHKIYFQYSSEPENLYQGDTIELKENGVEVQLKEIVDGNYNIRSTHL